MQYGDSPELGLPSKGTPFRFRLLEWGYQNPKTAVRRDQGLRVERIMEFTAGVRG